MTTLHTIFSLLIGNRHVFICIAVYVSFSRGVLTNPPAFSFVRWTTCQHRFNQIQAKSTITKKENGLYREKEDERGVVHTERRDPFSDNGTTEKGNMKIRSKKTTERKTKPNCTMRLMPTI